MGRNFFAGACLLWALCLASAAPALAGEDALVREVFGRLPLTIFENTPEGLSDEERQELLEQNSSNYWKIATESDRSLRLVSLPFEESVVDVRLFPQSCPAAPCGQFVGIGTRSPSMCTIELWQEDKNGRIVPAESPQEPPISDFFAPKTRIPKDVEPSVLICLGEHGLEAMPIFWNASGMAYIPVDNDVLFNWNGTAFEKKILPKAQP